MVDISVWRGEKQVTEHQRYFLGKPVGHQPMTYKGKGPSYVNVFVCRKWRFVHSTLKQLPQKDEMEKILKGLRAQIITVHVNGLRMKV